MRLSKFLSVIFSVTLFSLLYVYQQSEIYRLAYSGQKRQSILDELNNQNCVLKYNIEKNGSLVQIGDKMSGNSSGFEMPDSYRMMKMYYTGDQISSNKQAKAKESLLSKIFGVKSEAQAKTISPSITPLVNSQAAKTVNR
jgi:hypothetical protein